MKALVLFSGGLDSSVCLGMAVNRYGADEVLALSIYYGQKHKKEMEASEKIAAYYGVKRITLDLGEIFRDSTCTLLEGAEGDNVCSFQKRSVPLFRSRNSTESRL